MTTETTKLHLDKSRGIKLSTGEHVAHFDKWACEKLRKEIVRRFNDYEDLRRYAEGLERERT